MERPHEPADQELPVALACHVDEVAQLVDGAAADGPRERSEAPGPSKLQRGVCDDSPPFLRDLNNLVRFVPKVEIKVVGSVADTNEHRAVTGRAPVTALCEPFESGDG